MGQALYRSYRPKQLGDVVGQEHITTALAHALKNGTFSHAYLFTGPRGTGKTTIARILAHEINALPYEDDAMHLDIIEIDAASNRRIDEIRDLRDKVNLAPAAAKYKVYIIDEVHMLTREAFNALLKTLEEPPSHVVFMLATTEMHKLPETIVSRTQHFALKPVELSKVVAHLRTIADAEKIKVDDDALKLIAQHGEGSFRDSISLLDQLRNQAGTVTLANVQASLGIAPEAAVAALVEAVQQHDAVSVVAQLKSLHEQGYEASQLARQLGYALRAALVGGEASLPPDATLALLAQLVTVPASHEPRITLEIALLEAAFNGVAAGEANTASAAAAPAKTPTPAKPAAAKTMSEVVQAKPASITAPHPSSFKKDTSASKGTHNTHKTAEAVPKAPTIPTPSEPASSHDGKADSEDGFVASTDEADAGEPSNATLDHAAWDKTLGTIKTQYNTLYGLLRAAEVTFEPGVVIITSPYAFHQKRLNEQKNRDLIAKTVEAVSGHRLQITCLVGEVSVRQTPTPPPLPPENGETVHMVGGRQNVNGSDAPQAQPGPKTPTATPAAIAGSSTAASEAPMAPASYDTPAAKQKTQPADAIATVSNIFGGAELLQS